MADIYAEFKSSTLQYCFIYAAATNINFYLELAVCIEIVKPLWFNRQIWRYIEYAPPKKKQHGLQMSNIADLKSKRQIK